MKAKEETMKMKDEGELRKIFESNPEIRRLLSDRRKHMSVLNYAQAFRIDGILNKAWDGFVRQNKFRGQSLFEATFSMEKEDRERCLVNFYSLALMVDCFDFMLEEVKEVLKKYGLVPHLDNMERINKFAKAASTEVKAIVGEITFDGQEGYALRSDELREAIFEKVRKGYYQDSLMRARTSGCNI